MRRFLPVTARDFTLEKPIGMRLGAAGTYVQFAALLLATQNGRVGPRRIQNSSNQ